MDKVCKLETPMGTSTNNFTPRPFAISSPVSTTPLPSPFSRMNRPNPPPALTNAFSHLQNSSIDLAAKINAENAGLNQNATFTKEQFQALCDEQRKDFKGQGKEVGIPGGGMRSPCQVIEMSWSPRSEENFELADEVNEWVEFLPYWGATGKTALVGEGKENAALGLCKWILTTRSQDESGQWKYVDRTATMEEVLRFKEKGWPYYR